METRKYFLDWLRVGAFVLLILFHVGMLYVSWRYDLKSQRLFPAIEPLMNGVSAWRLALLFVISGVAARFLIDKLGPGAFARDRLRRLLPVILTGMYVVIPPQTYVVLVSRGATHMDFATFWWTQYLRADQTLVRPLHMTMPTWDHIWFLVYLLIYALFAAGAIWAGKRLGAGAGPRLSPWGLLLAPAAWMALTNLIVLTKWPITDALVNDWGGHLKWAGLFVTGLVAARQDRFWALLQAHWGKLLVVAAVLLAIQSRVNDPAWSVISGLYGWAAICALCGFAKAALNRPSVLLSHLNEAVLPIYVLHQPIMLVTAFWLFPLRLPVGVEVLLLTGATGLGALALYETIIRPFRLSRILFGLKPKTASGDPRPAMALATISGARAMLIYRVLGWCLLGLVGLAAVASALGDIRLVAARGSPLSPNLACTVMWNLWVGSWIAAMYWSRRATARPLALQEMGSLVLPVIGFGLLGFGSLVTHFTPLWSLPGGLGWVFVALCGSGLLFTWWARATLGSLWSAAVSRKDGHSVVQSGPYRLVRHPIYTGLIIAGLAQAIIVGQAANLTGAFLVTVGFWLKARLEERFLSDELGSYAYADYRRRTPMLIPFWPLKT